MKEKKENKENQVDEMKQIQIKWTIFLLAIYKYVCKFLQN